jgi:hypothetical protein
MRGLRTLVIVVVILGLACSARPAQAAFHLWSISEIYSSSDGSVQFIELFTTSFGQNSTGGTSITSNGHTYTFPSNISGTITTTGKRMLLATAGFGALTGGVAPDFATLPLPSNFFNPAGDTLTYVGTIFAGTTFGPTPADGVKSLNYPGATVANNTPTNLAGTSGSVNVPPSPAGDYNGNHVVDAADYTVWRDHLGQDYALPNRDPMASGVIDTPDYDFWVSHFGNGGPGAGGGAGQSSAIPEPAGLVLAAIGLLVLGALCTVGYSGRTPQI